MSFSTDKWLYYTLSVPMITIFGVLGAYFYDHSKLSNKKMWKVSFISALTISLISGTVGSIICDIIIGGSLQGINFEGRVIWGIIYTLIFLPVTVMVGKIIIEIFAQFIKAIKK